MKKGKSASVRQGLFGRLAQFGLSAGLALSLLACGGGAGGGNPGSNSGAASSSASSTPASIEIAPNTVLLTQTGQTKPLNATVRDAGGNTVTAPLTWESSNPQAVSVNAQGVLTAVGSGSSQITARTGEVRSAPLLAVRTDVPAGAVLLQDSQIVGEPEATDPTAPPNPANTYRVRLTGVAAPQVGALLLNTESKIVGGRVQSVQTVGGDYVVTLERVPARQMFPRLQLRELFDLSQAEVVFPADLQSSYTIARDGNTYTFAPIPGRVELNPSSAKPATASGDRLQKAAASSDFKIGPFKCKSTLDGAAGAGSEVLALSSPPVFSASFKPSVDVIYTEANGLERFVLVAEPAFSGTVGLQAVVAFEGKITCEVELLSIRLPIGGPIALIIGGQLPVGMGVELGGKLTVANFGVSATASVSTALRLGLGCPDGTNCAVVTEVDPLKTAFTPQMDLPLLVEDIRLEPSLSIYGYIKASIGNPFLRALRFDAFKATVGPSLKGSFAPKSAQMFDPAYQSSYKLVGEIKAGADTNFIDLAAFLGLNNIAANALELSADIASTPAGTVTANKVNAVLGETVEFTVKLDPTKIDFLPVVGPYNVKRVVLVRDISAVPLLGAVSKEVASVDAVRGQTEFKLSFTPASAAEAGPTDKFYAFVVTTLLPTDLFALELGRAQEARGQGQRVSASTFHSCALTSGGTVRCWGYSDHGQLGNGSTTDGLVPVNVTGLGSGVTAISAGVVFSCAVTSGGAVKCWGYNRDGQLGNGNIGNSLVPVDVTGLGSGVTAISAGGANSCALTSGGAVKCWGYNGDGQLGNGSTVNSSVPVDVTGLGSGVTAISAGSLQSCALTSGGAIKCWGSNVRGQLGNGSTTNSLVPVDARGLGSGVTAISTGERYSCALNSGGAMKCWGTNEYGQLGIGSRTIGSLVAVDVVGFP